MGYGSDFHSDKNQTFWANKTAAAISASTVDSTVIYLQHVLGDEQLINAGLKTFGVDIMVGSLDAANGNETYEFQLKSGPNKDKSGTTVTHSKTATTRGYSGPLELMIPRVGPLSVFSPYLWITLDVGGTTPGYKNLWAALVCRQNINDVFVPGNYDYRVTT